MYSFGYVGDIVSAILFLIIKGETGEAYNITSKDSDIKLKDLANLISNYIDKKVVFELLSEVERKGYSNAIKSVLNSQKIERLGWKSITSIEKGIHDTIDILLAKNKI